MNGVHDMGGMQCFGPVLEAADEPLFHHDWERRVFALTLAMGSGGAWNIDASRFQRESLPAALYLEGGYYRTWLEALERLLERSGLLSQGQGSQGAATTVPVSRLTGAAFNRLEADTVMQRFSRGWPSERPAHTPARFAVGESIRTVNRHPAGHTRLPRYARGRHGTVCALRGVHVLPDSNATFSGERPEWLYSVRFEACELWGPDTTASCVYLDCWESYLTPVGGDAHAA